ncbi:hypothetical protein EYC84_004729 [Monilinia fructicola]|uniref:DUF1776-domain-containing protein n=2 Tax=Monilinia fructicola TaxID=38448 RepID=A0A5M9K1B4_MONFR|nr:hypothetical protein EYC84_004729 [Monilinia fructicola]
MSADDQVFLDILSSVPNDVKRYSNDVAEYVERHIERVAASIRVSLASAEWIPPSARPRPPPPARIPSAPVYTRIEQWVSKNKLLTGAIIIVLGGVTYYVTKRKSNYRKKRRAKRAATGARQEVVVIAGSPSEPITRSISLDLERKGFIVYIVCNTIEDEVLVQNEARQDIKPLMIDIVDPSSASAAIDRFIAHLRAPHSPFQGGKTHNLIFRSLILIPSLTYPSSPIATLSASALSDLLNTRLLNPILTLQNFLPLLTQLPFQGLSSGLNAPKPSVLVLTPNIIPSLSPAFHAPESSTISFLKTFTQTLTSELSPLSIPNQLQSYRSRSPTTSSDWDPTSRHVYSRNYTAINSGNVGAAMGCGSIGGGHGKGSSLRELHNAVFDAMERQNGGVIRVGMGSSVYGFIGAWVPRGLVGWMMGVRKFKDESAEEDAHASIPESSSTTSSEGRALTPDTSALAGSDYISVMDLEGN